MTIDLDAVDLTAVVEEVARHVHALNQDHPDWDDEDAMVRHHYREQLTPVVFYVINALKGAGDA